MDDWIANAIYDILVGTCEAPESMREDFVKRLNYEAFTMNRSQRAVGDYEYHFSGNLGSGTFHMVGLPFQTPTSWYVSCYAEDETPERKLAIEAATERLESLRKATMSTAAPINDPGVELGEGRAVELGGAPVNDPGSIADKVQAAAEAEHEQQVGKKVLWRQAVGFPFGWTKLGTYKDESSAKRAERKRRAEGGRLVIMPEGTDPLPIR